MAKIWRSRDIIGAEDAQRWENKADATHRHKVADIDGLEEIISNQTTNKANQADLTGHIQNQNNPHNVTKAQVGLGNVTNVEQASKQDFQHHLDNHNNPHSVTKAQIGLENVTNVEQASKVDFDAHATNRNNPHNVTKSQVGLANVTNVEQASKTDFDAHARDTTKHITQQERTAWNGKADGRALTDHTGNHNNPHGVTKTQVGLGNVVNVEQASKSEFNSHSQNSAIHVTSVDKNRWNGAQLTKLTEDNGSAKRVSGDWNNVVETGMYTGTGLKNSPEGRGVPLYVTVTKMDYQNVMQQAVDNTNTFTAVRTKVNGVWGSWQVFPRLKIKVIPIQFEPGVEASPLAKPEDNKIYVFETYVLVRLAITGNSLKNAPKKDSFFNTRKLFYLPKELIKGYLYRGQNYDGSLDGSYTSMSINGASYTNQYGSNMKMFTPNFEYLTGLCFASPPEKIESNYCNMSMWLIDNRYSY